MIIIQGESLGVMKDNAHQVRTDVKNQQFLNEGMYDAIVSTGQAISFPSSSLLMHVGGDSLSLERALS